MAELTIQQALDLALSHHRAGRLPEAESIYRQILAVQPDQPDALHLLGRVAYQVGRPDAAVELVARAVAAVPDSARYQQTLGDALAAVGRLGEASAHLSQACELDPGNPEPLNNLANVLSRAGHHDQAAARFEQLLAGHPDLAAGHSNYAVALKALGRLGASARHGRRAVELMPDLPQAYNNLANTLIAQGRYVESAAARRRALALKPDYALAHSNLLLELHYAEANPEALFAEHVAWARRQAGAHSALPHFRPTDSPGRRLRVGYVSPDFYAHVVSYFIEPVLRHHDRERFEVYCYSDVVAPDAITRRIAEACAGYRSIAGIPNQEVAAAIRADGIDLLIDLAGHTHGARLPLFALKPAPVQLTYLGYPDTTGLSAVDYRITDPYADPPGLTEKFHTERLLRLPATAWCYQPPADAPPVRPTSPGPRPVTFACFNALPKLSDHTLDLWSRILGAVPGSRLLIKSMGLEDQETRDLLAARIAARGITPDRVTLLGKARLYAEHLATYHGADVALDTYPYHGTSTTCEALYMGVPVVTLAGPAHVSRVGVSLLTNVGLPDLIASGAEEYVGIAAGLAADPARLADLRSTLRDRLMASPIGDARAFVRDLESAYERVWRGAFGSPDVVIDT